jgi:isopenicillin N synthase-like dioxygenase
MSSKVTIPILDIGALVTPGADPAAKQAVIRELVAACEDIGFFIIKNHGVDSSVIDSMWKATSDFFDLETDYKMTYNVEKQSDYPFGYSGIGGEILVKGKDAEKSTSSGGLPDLKELFSLGPSNPRSGFPARIFPTRPEAFEKSWEAYYDALSNVASKILSGFAVGLGQEEDFFEEFLGHHASAVRAINYPSYEGYEPPAGQLRASAHTDYGTITILKSGPGLQVSKDKDEPDWVDVPFVEDAFIVNLGDLMRRWTNDKWLSTLHRVVNPPAGTPWARRQSVAFFHNPNKDAVVKPLIKVGSDEVPIHDPIVAGDFLMQKHLAATSSK